MLLRPNYVDFEFFFSGGKQLIFFPEILFKMIFEFYQFLKKRKTFSDLFETNRRHLVVAIEAVTEIVKPR